MLDWSQCTEVERHAETLGGSLVFKGTRVPVKALFENLQGGATIDDFLAWFPGVNRAQVEAVLEFAGRSGLTDWLLACPEKGFFVPIDSASTDTLPFRGPR